MASLYAADGSIRVTVVDGTSKVSRYAADGSWNVVLSPDPVVEPIGLFHASGAMNVTVAPEDEVVGFYAPDGSMYVCESPYNPKGAVKVTVVTGDLTP